MDNYNPFDEHFDLGSFLPLLLFIIGIYTIYLFSIKNYGFACFMLVLSFFIYVLNNITINIRGHSSVFNEYLEDMAVFTAFILSTIVFGVVYYENEALIFGIIIFYAMCFILALARNWVLRKKNSLGFPAALNGVFFPLLYYIYSFYLGSPANSIFLIYYVVVGMLSVSTINFLGYRESNNERFSEPEEISKRRV